MYKLITKSNGKSNDFATEVEFISHVQTIFHYNEGSGLDNEPTTLDACVHYVVSYCNNLTVELPKNVRQINKAAQY